VRGLECVGDLLRGAECPADRDRPVRYALRQVVTADGTTFDRRPQVDLCPPKAC
jgi:hypothetical protein